MARECRHRLERPRAPVAPVRDWIRAEPCIGEEALGVDEGLETVVVLRGRRREDSRASLGNRVRKALHRRNGSVATVSGEASVADSEPEDLVAGARPARTSTLPETAASTTFLASSLLRSRRR